MEFLKDKLALSGEITVNKKELIGERLSHWHVTERIFKRFSEYYPYKPGMIQWWSHDNDNTADTKIRWGRWLWLKELEIVKSIMQDLKAKKTPYKFYPPSLKKFIEMYMERGGLIRRD